MKHKFMRIIAVTAAVALAALGLEALVDPPPPAAAAEASTEVTVVGTFTTAEDDASRRLIVDFGQGRIISVSKAAVDDGLQPGGKANVLVSGASDLTRLNAVERVLAGTASVKAVTPNLTPKVSSAPIQGQATVHVIPLTDTPDPANPTKAKASAFQSSSYSTYKAALTDSNTGVDKIWNSATNGKIRANLDLSSDWVLLPQGQNWCDYVDVWGKAMQTGLRDYAGGSDYYMFFHATVKDEVTDQTSKCSDFAGIASTYWNYAYVVSLWSTAATTAHELGHLFGYGHSNTIESLTDVNQKCPDGGWQSYAKGCPAGVDEYGDQISIMGSRYSGIANRGLGMPSVGQSYQLKNVSKWPTVTRYDLIADADVQQVTVGAATPVTLKPATTFNRPMAARIPVSSGVIKGDLWVEYRTKAASQVNVPDNMDGVQVRYVPYLPSAGTSIGGPESSFMLRVNSSTDTKARYLMTQSGDSWTEPVTGAKIVLNTISATQANITVSSATAPSCSATIAPTTGTLKVGASQTFTATPTNCSGYTVQWQKKGPSDADFKDIPYATASTYAYTAVGADVPSVSFRAKYSNGTTPVNSNVATLSVDDIKCEATVSPVTPSAAAGSAVTFTVTENAGCSGWSRQWQILRVGDTWKPISGQVGTSYQMSNVGTGDNQAQIRVLYTRSGQTDTSSKPATLTVIPPTTGCRFTTQPASGADDPGEVRVFYIAAADCGDYTLTWETKQVGGSWVTNPPRTPRGTDYYHSVRASDQGMQVRAVYTKGSDRVESQIAVLTLRTQCVFEESPFTITRNAGENAKFSFVPGPGCSNYTIRWYKSGKTSGYVTTTTPTLDLGTVGPDDNGTAVWATMMLNGASISSKMAYLYIAACDYAFQPSSVQVFSGQYGSFTALRGAACAAYTQSWEKRAAGAAWAPIPYANSAYTSLLADAASNGAEVRSVLTYAPTSTRVESSAAKLSLVSNASCKFGSNPASVSVDAGATASFDVSSHIDCGGFSTKWRTKKPGGTWSDLISGDSYFSYVTGADDDGTQVQSVMVYGSTMIYSGIATISLNQCTVTAQPASVVKESGDVAYFNSAVSPGCSGYTKSWQRLAPTSGATWTPIANSATLSYGVAALAGDTGTKFRLVLKLGAREVPSEAALMTVTAPAQTQCVVTDNPSSAIAAVGASTAFSVKPSTGCSGYSLKWQKRALYGSWGDLPSETSQTVWITPGVGDDQAQYRAVYRSGTTEVASQPATLQLAKCSFTKHPASRGAWVGGTATFDTAAANCGAYTLTWQKRVPGGAWTQLSGGGNGSYTTPILTLGDSGYEYQAVYRLGSVAVTSDIATLTTKPYGECMISRQPNSISKNPGETATFSLTTGAFCSGMSYQWQKAAAGSSVWTDVPGAKFGSLSVTALPKDAGARYRVVTTLNGKATSSEEATLTVNACTFTKKPGVYRLHAGDTAMFGVEVGSACQAYDLSWRVVMPNGDTRTVSGVPGVDLKVALTDANYPTTSVYAELTYRGDSSQPKVTQGGNGVVAIY